MTTHKKVEGTARPWKADYAGGYGRRGIFGPNGLIVTTWAETDEHINEAEANAKLIVQAVNSHALLVDALEKVMSGNYSWEQMRYIAKAVIKKVRG